jgi:hypothetical protein
MVLPDWEGRILRRRRSGPLFEVGFAQSKTTKSIPDFIIHSQIDF